ncbi:MAG: transcriptional repressor LexA [Chloroflexota bacterium]|nr:transcriptional repressor LexA [Chloroflexota bacterium]
MAAKKKKQDKLSPKQERILLFIEDCIAERSQPPSIREICDSCNISSTSVADYNLKRLEEKGYISRMSNVSRGIQVLQPIGALRETEESYNVPICGKIAAGAPIPLPEESQPEDFIEIAKNHLRAPSGRKLFALRVEGQSMIDALVDDGDVVILSSQETADNGDMVAAWIRSREEATLKRFYQQGDKVVLRPANRSMFTEEEIKTNFTFPASDVQINGKVCFVFRQM